MTATKLTPASVQELRDLVGGTSGPVRVPAHVVGELLDAYEENERGQFDLLAEMQRRDDALDEVERLRAALHEAEAALADIGDAEREPGDDLAWCEKRAADALPAVRAALAVTKEEATDG